MYHLIITDGLSSAVGLARLLHNYAPFLENRARFHVTEPCPLFSDLSPIPEY